MIAEPHGVTVFCDDIRFEVSGKITLVGCYVNELKFSKPAPGTLLTLGMLVNIRIPTAYKFEKLRLVVTKQEGKESTEILTAETEYKSEYPEPRTNDLAIDGDEPVIAMTFPCQWRVLEVSENAFIRVRAYLDEEIEIKLGILQIVFPDNDEFEESEPENEG